MKSMKNMKMRELRVRAYLDDRANERVNALLESRNRCRQKRAG